VHAVTADGVGGQVLVQRAAEVDVEQLQAAADRQHRQAPVERGGQERELAVVARPVEADGGVRLLAVQRRIDVGAAGEHERVHPGGDGGGIGARGHVHRQRARGDQLVGVAREVDLDLQQVELRRPVVDACGRAPAPRDGDERGSGGHRTQPSRLRHGTAEDPRTA
jgi:hypothetical protein